MGLRWDYFIRPYERFGRVVGIEGSAFPISQLHFKKPGDPLIPQDFEGLGPRIGFAYNLGNKTVIRGGVGIFVGLNYPAMTTAATSSYIPPVIPASLFNSAYTRSITYFNRSQWPNLAFPDNSFISPSAILQTLAVFRSVSNFRRSRLEKYRRLSMVHACGTSLDREFDFIGGVQRHPVHTYHWPGCL